MYKSNKAVDELAEVTRKLNLNSSPDSHLPSQGGVLFSQLTLLTKRVGGYAHPIELFDMIRTQKFRIL